MRPIEELLAALGGTNSLEADPIRTQIEAYGEAALEPMFRAATDLSFREELWERYGSQFDGLLMFRVGNPEGKGPRIGRELFLGFLFSGALSWLQSHPKRREEPVRGFLERANQGVSESYVRPSKTSLGIPDNPWTRYLDACGRRDLPQIRAYFARNDVNPEAAEAGLGTILGDVTLSDELGLSPQTREVLEFLVEQGGDVDTELHPNIGCIALHYAAQKGDIETLSWLLDHGADINYADFDGRNALMFAASGNGRTDAHTFEDQRQTLLFLLEGGADIAAQQKRHYEATERSEAFDFTGPTLGDFTSPELRAFLESRGYMVPLPAEI